MRALPPRKRLQKVNVEGEKKGSEDALVSLQF